MGGPCVLSSLPCSDARLCPCHDYTTTIQLLQDGLVVDGYANVLMPLLEDGLRDRIRLGCKVISVSVDTLAAATGALGPAGHREPARVDEADDVSSGESGERDGSLGNGGCVSVKFEREAARQEGAGAEGCGRGLEVGVGEVEADFVVVTLPLGVLKAKTVAFDPPLPREKRRAIEAIGMGTENKVVLRFSELFWDAQQPYLQTLHPHMRFLNGDFFGKHRTLIAHLSPPLSRTDAPDGELVALVLSTLQDMFDRNDLEQLLRAHIVTRWDRDEFARGSYSYMSVGATVRDVEELARPCHSGRVLWAGEACSVEGMQCVHGAYMAGKEAANMIIHRVLELEAPCRRAAMSSEPKEAISATR